MKKRILTVFVTVALFLNLFTCICFATSKGNAITIAPGADLQESLNAGGSRLYRISADETQYYEFKIRNQSIEVNTGIGFADGFLNLFLGKMHVKIYDAYDEDVASLDVRCGYTGTLSVRFQKDKVYYVEVSSTVSGNYHLNLNKLTDLGANTWKEATLTESTGKTVSEIEAAGDVDWFRFKTDELRSYYKFELENLQATGWLYITLYEYVPSADQLRDVSISGSNNYIYARVNETGSFNIQLKQNTEYYFEISGSSSVTGDYILTATRSADAAGNSMTKEDAYKIDAGIKYTTSFDGTKDSDYYVFTTPDYDVYCHVNYTYLSFNAFTRSELYDEDGNELAEGYANSYNFSYSEKLKPNTTYYVRFYGDGVGNYEFNIDLKADTYANEMALAKEVETNTTIGSSFDGKQDSDYVKFTTPDYDVYCHVNYTYLSFNAFTRSELYDEDGNELAEGYANSYNFSYSEKLKPSTTYYIRFYGDGVGNYEFTIDLKPDVNSDKKESATVLSSNEKYLSSLEASDDVDWFKVELDSSANMLVTLLNESVNKISFKVYSSRDSELMSNTYISKGLSGSDSEQLDAGTYYIKVYGTSSGYYTLTVSPCGNGHTEVIDYAVEASCTGTGLSEGKHCSVCNTVIKKQETVSAKGHSYKNGTCTACGEKDPNYVPSFTDVKSNAWYKKYVDYCVKNDIFDGTSATTFSPNTNITRAQFVQVLANVTGIDTSNRHVSTAFSDVPQGKWYTAAVKWASENGVVNGMGGGKFAPNANVTREQMCLMLVNYSGYRGVTLNAVEAKENFADDASISKWAKAAVYTCQQANIVNGKGAGKFDPKGTGTRAEACVMFTAFHKDYLVK